MTMERLDDNGDVVDSLFIGDGCSTSIFIFSHYALMNGGIYRLRLFTDTYSECSTTPEGAVAEDNQTPTEASSYAISNAYRSGDSFLIALPWSSNVNANVVLRSWDNVYVELSKVNMLSFEDVRDSPERAFWQDFSNDLVWVKYFGGIDPPPPADIWTDHELARFAMIYITPAPTTDWSLVSSLLEDETMAPLLPRIPLQEDVSSQLYTEESSASDSYPFKVAQIRNFDEVAGLCNDSDVLSTALAGPNEDGQCRAVINTKSIQLVRDHS